jgi:hypothetical protein
MNGKGWLNHIASHLYVNTVSLYHLTDYEKLEHRVSGIILLSLCSTAMAEVVPRCRFNPGVEDPIIDSKCSVKVEGSLDSKYKGNRTFVPEKATIRWSDGVTTQIEFKSIFDVKGGVAEGAASVDGHLYRFTRSGDGRGLLFRTLDPNLNAKEISIYFDYKK